MDGRTSARPANLAALAVLFGLMTAMLIMAPATRSGAHHGVGCGGPWTESASCTIPVWGLPLGVFAEGTVATGTSDVHVSLSFESAGRGVILLECEASAEEYARCEDEMGEPVDIGSLLYPNNRNIPLTCRVEGNGSGWYGCVSGL